MAQFDVYKNSGRNTSKRFPFLVDIQNNFLANLATRIVIPLGIAAVLDRNTMRKLAPIISYQGNELFLMTNQIFTIQAKHLDDPIGSLSDSRQLILNALDFAIAGY